MAARPPELAKNMKFRTTSRLDCDYLQNATTHCQSENDVANYVYFGPQTVKNRIGVLIHPSTVVQRTGVKKSVALT